MGRPGTTVELDGQQVCGLGAEINVNHVSTLALDLGGAVVSEHKLGLDARAMSADEVIARLADQVQQSEADLARRGITPVGLTVGVAGLVDRDHDVLTRGPNLGWRDVPVGDLLRERLGAAYPVSVDNEGNLAAIAEATPGDPDRQDILVIFGEVGVGGGIVADGRLLRGQARVRRRVRPHDRGAPGAPLRLRPGRLLGDGQSACGRCSTSPPTPTTRCAIPRSPSTTGSPRSTARGAGRHPHHGRARPGRRAGSASAPPCSPTRSTRRRSCSAATSPRSASTCAPPSRRGCRQGCSLPTPEAPGSSSPPLGFTAAVRGGAPLALDSRLRRPDPGRAPVRRRRSRQVTGTATTSGSRGRDAPPDDRASSRSSRVSGRSTAWTSTSAPARCTACSARTAPASPR